MKKNPDKQNALLKLTIPQGLKDDFKILCQIIDCTMTHAVIQLLEEIAEAYEVTESTVRYHLQRRSQKIGEYNPLDKAS